MEKLQIEGKDFIKANTIAKQFGYTADYVGQLCRAGKVESQLVGRSWYVLESSLREHKAQRQRSSKEYSARSVAKTLETEESSESIKPAFYTHAATTAVTYHRDEEALVPETKKPTPPLRGHVLSVGLADASEVAVAADDAPYEFTEIERPEPIFKGDIVIASAEIEPEPDEELVETAELEASVASDKITGVKRTPVKKLVLGNPTGAITIRKSSATPKHHHAVVSDRFMQRVTGSTPSPDQTVTVKPVVGHSRPLEAPVQHISGGVSIPVVAASILLGLLVNGLLLSVNHSLSAVASEQVRTIGYSIDVSSLIASIYQAI